LIVPDGVGRKGNNDADRESTTISTKAREKKRGDGRKISSDDDLGGRPEGEGRGGYYVLFRGVRRRGTGIKLPPGYGHVHGNTTGEKTRRQ